MRRPLCYLCMAFVAAVFIILKIRPMQEHALQEGTEGSEVTWQGKVTAKEYKNESLILYLYKEMERAFCVIWKITESQGLEVPSW